MLFLLTSAVLYWESHTCMIEKQYSSVMRTSTISPKNGVEYIVRAHSMNTNTTLFSARQMKWLINTNKRYMLMVVRAKDVEASDAFKGCDPSHKKDMIDIVANYDEIF